MAFKLTQFGSDSSNIKSIFHNPRYYRYYNKDNNTLTTAGYFPDNLGLEVNDRIIVIPADPKKADELYVVTSVSNGVVVEKAISGEPTGIYLEQFDEMPEATEETVGKIVQYIGETGDYTNGYVYKNTATPVYDSTVEFNPASLSSTTVTCSGEDFAAFVVENGSGDIDTIIKGTLTYDESGELLVFVGQDDTDTTVCTFQVYTQDYEDAGFTFTGTLQDGDVITFTTTITESQVYGWARIDVQPTE